MGGALVQNGPLLVLGAPATDHPQNALMNGLVLVRGVHDIHVNGFD